MVGCGVGGFGFRGVIGVLWGGLCDWRGESELGVGSWVEGGVYGGRGG